ncbi:MAG: response regulator [Spirochaetales bacterium]
MEVSNAYILIVEDEDSIRIPLKDYLTRIGFTVLVASDGVGAIKQLLDFPVQYIITDYRMETLGGDYWIRFLQRYCHEIKVLVTSGFLKSDLPIPFEFLAKPYSFKELEARLRAL